MTNFDDFSKRYQDHKKAIAEANMLNKAVVFDALAAGKVTRVTIEFDGEGDSGQLNDITAFSGDTHIKLPAIPVTLRRSQWNTDGLITQSEALDGAIETLCYDYLEQKHGGGRTTTAPTEPSSSTSEIAR